MKDRTFGSRLGATLVVALGAVLAFAAIGGAGLAGGLAKPAKSQYGPGQYQYGAKVTICHKQKVTIRVSVNAVPHVKQHGDTLGCATAAAAKAKALGAKLKAKAAKLKAAKAKLSQGRQGQEGREGRQGCEGHGGLRFGDRRGREAVQAGQGGEARQGREEGSEGGQVAADRRTGRSGRRRLLDRTREREGPRERQRQRERQEVSSRGGGPFRPAAVLSGREHGPVAPHADDDPAVERPQAVRGVERHGRLPRGDCERATALGELVSTRQPQLVEPGR